MIRLHTLVLSLFGIAVGADGSTQQILTPGGDPDSVRPLNVAIIGAGAGGASSTYHLSQFAEAAGIPINITVFERNSYIGGRSTTVNAYDDPTIPVELGASIFVEVNAILANATRDFGLSTSGFSNARSSKSGPALGVWDGQSFVVTQDGESGWWDIAKLLWKYGLAPIRTVRLMKATVGKFLQMYEAPIFPFESLTQAAEDVGLLEVVSSTGEQLMEAAGITGAFGHDIVQASTRVNYAQNLKHIHGLEAMVCMATDGAMSIDGGNWQIFDRMIAATDATTQFETEVLELKQEADGSYIVDFQRRAEDFDVTSRSQQFDHVVLASPFQYSKLSISPKLTTMPDDIPYVKLHVTLFTSPHLLAPQYFGLSPDQQAPEVILTTLPPDESPKQGNDSCGSPGFYSISLLQPVRNPESGAFEYLYKIFSPSPPNATFFFDILGLSAEALTDNDDLVGKDITWIYRKVWNSYPYELPRVTFEDIRLSSNLWYTSGIESFISTMETSALMGRNVARLLVDTVLEQVASGDLRFWHGTPPKTEL